MKTKIIYGQKVRELRDARGWTQEHLAEVSGTTHRTIQRLESNETRGQESLMAVADALEVSVKDLQSVVYLPERRIAAAERLTTHREFIAFQQRYVSDAMSYPVVDERGMTVEGAPVQFPRGAIAYSNRDGLWKCE
jgi:transcriptional regulator with XRE-family HTH domain